jgi:hypothetical protein
MLLSVVSVLVVVLPSSEVPEGLVNYPVYIFTWRVLTIVNSCTMNIHEQPDIQWNRDVPGVCGQTGGDKKGSTQFWILVK